jgi:2OG-Fe(II) oxygenase superfamily
MANDGISVPYNRDLKTLEKLLSGVRRPGDFFVQGLLETPMPRVEIEGVGVVSFPVPEAQIQEIIQQATRAPYGRGEATIHDESVRKTWQLPASVVRIGGKTWQKTFSQILNAVTEGLGCAEAEVSAELYKLLVYDPGGFFAAHRDTEKAGGMFGTLVVALPSLHRGGELVVRHAGREFVADLSSDEFSELKFAAFYADCEHEVRPVTEGHRVCLVYNLIQQPGGTSEEPLNAPLYSSEIDAAGKMLKEAFSVADAPAKLAWLLEHQYSPDGLSFAGLKGEDAALAKVLRAAAERAGCAVHLGIIHIEENGPAEPDYDSHAYGGSRWRQYDEDGMEDDEASSDDFEAIEVSDGSRHIDQWVNTQDQPVAYGRLPLEEGEVLPAGALDDEAPDEQRLMEATGNEGASFERSYHRAALVIWPRGRFAGVLLQAGVSAALPHLAERLAAGDPAATGIARQIIDVWEQPPTRWSYRSLAEEPSRAGMLRVLTKLGDRELLKRFISGVVTREFDGSENAELGKALALLGAKEAGKLLAGIVRENFPMFHCACVNLANLALRELGESLNNEWRSALLGVAAIMVQALPAIQQPKTDPYVSANWHRAQKAKPADADMVAGLLEFLRAIGAGALRMTTAAHFATGAEVFAPGKVIVPALKQLQEHERKAFVSDAAAGRLWVHAAEFLLARSEEPPSPPTDWRQAVTISCQCEDCRGLQKFASDPDTQVARFRVRQDRRQHLHQQIEHHGLDMSHVTERKGSPQTLVCTKTRRTFERQCEQHRADCGSMTTLLEVMRPMPDALANLARRLTAAKERKPQKLIAL